MVVTYWVNSIISGRSPPLYCTLTLIAMQGHQKRQRKKQNKIKYGTRYIVIIYCYIGCEDEVTTLKRERRGPMIDVDIFNVIQKVQDTVIHLEVDEEQWKITQGSKRQAKWVWSLLLLCCCCLHIKNRSDLYPIPFSFLLFKAKKRISVVTS